MTERRVPRIAVVIVVLIVAGCASSPSQISQEPSSFPIVGLPVRPGLGLGVGPAGGCGSVAFSDLRVRGDPTQTPSVWVEELDGSALRVVRWPPGFIARFEPGLVIYDAHRRPVARDGDILRDTSGDPSDHGFPSLLSFNGVDYPCE